MRKFALLLALLAVQLFASEQVGRTVVVGYYAEPGMMDGARPGEEKSGYAYEYIQEIASHAGWRYKYEYGHFADLYEKLLRGEIDVLPYITRSKARESIMHFPDMAMGDEQFYISSMTPGALGDDLSELRGKKIGTTKNAFQNIPFNALIAEKGVECELIEFEQPSYRWDALEKGEIDYTIETTTILQDRPIHAVYEFGDRYPYYLVVANGREDLLNELNAAQLRTTEINPAFLNDLRFKYFRGIPLFKMLPEDAAGWLKAHPSIRIASYDRQAPYISLDGNGEAVGILPDSVDLMLKAVGVEHHVEWKLYAGRDEALAALNADEIDLINPYYHGYADAERDGVIISSTVYDSRFGILYRGEYSEKTLSRVATPETRLGMRYMRDNYPGTECVGCTDGYDGVDKLLKGEATCVAMYLSTLQKIAGEYDERFNIKVIGAPCPVCFAALPKNAALIDLVNKAVPYVSRVDFNAIENRHSVATETNISGSQFFKRHPEYVYGAVITLLSLAVVGMLLRRRVVIRHVAAMEAANDALDYANRHEKIRGDTMDFIFKNNDIEKFIPYFAERVLDLYGCDQVIYRDSEGRMILNERPGTPPLDFSLCEDCPHYAFDAPVYADGVTVMDDCSVGYKGVPVHKDCRVKASLTQIVRRNGKAFGYIALHYLGRTHHFTPEETASFDRISKFLSLALDRVDADKRLKGALDMAESANRAKTNFLFGMSHDIRTPMNAIKGFTEIAMKNLDDREKTAGCLGKIEQAGDLLLSLINGVLDMSRIESGKAKLNEIEADVYESFLGVEPIMTEQAKMKGLSISFGFGEIKDRHVYADCDRGTRIFVNIVSNAIKYSRPGGWVKVRCEQIENAKGENVKAERPDAAPEHQTSNLKPQTVRTARYRYTFEDNGIGMSEEFQKHVFEQFSRERNSTTSGIQGTGLGMALCKELVELMGGAIACRSKQGEGTVFTVELPFRVRESVAADGERAGENVQAREESPKPKRLAGKRVLLVEDNEMNREVAEYILADQGLVVETAGDGSEAVDLFRRNAPGYYDFILMDIQMPVMGGYEATRSIRALESSRFEVRGLKSDDAQTSNVKRQTSNVEHVPIIALSANAFAEDREASLAAGMDEHLSKPIRAKALCEMLAKYA